MSLRQLISTDPLSRLRLAVLLLMAAVLAPALFRIWCIKGLVRTIRIDGPSMAETLRGNHFRVTCGDCGIIFRCDAGENPVDRLAVCPNCGFRENSLRDEDLRPGDKVLVDTWPYLWSAPKRGDVVMLVDPLPPGNAKSSFAVKRIAGLPGDQPAIHNGDLWSGSASVPKSLQEFVRVAVLVHDNDYPPRSLPTSRRWITGGLTSNWQATPAGFRLSPASDETQWLTYQHWHCSANPLPRTAPARIRDNDSYNQAQNHELHDVRDLLLRCRIRGESGLVVLSLRDSPHVFEVQVNLFDSRFCVVKNGSTVASDRLSQSTGSEFSLEAALCDGRFLLAQNQRLLAAFPYDGMSTNAEKQPVDENRRLRIGAAGGNVEISRLQVWRDIYYLAPTRRDFWQTAAPLADEHYFLLGDNSPVSIDSRQWDTAGVPGRDILGRVISRGSN